MPRQPRTSKKTVAAPKPTTSTTPVVEPRTSREVVADDIGVVETKEEPQPAHPLPQTSVHREGVPNGIILKAGDPVVLEGDDDGITVTVTRDVYRAIYPYGARRPTYILLYPRGAKVVKSLLQSAPKP